MQKGRGKKLGQQEQKEEINGGTKDRKRRSSEEMVQGEMGRCQIGEALWKTSGRKARYALLQTIKACVEKDTCYCQGVDTIPKAFQNRTEEKIRSASR